MTHNPADWSLERHGSKPHPRRLRHARAALAAEPDATTQSR
ncbi:hypothetical protein DSM104299_00252 [Baekduia alba]|nr:hypothetical protein DSM104299_00252 [Baekduia alba]